MTFAEEFPHVAKAEAYVADVIAGRVPACKWAVKACERHVADRARESEESWPYRFDAKKANRICEFGSKLPHVKGKWARKDPITRKAQRIQLEPWQCWLLSMLFGWVKKGSGMRRFRRASVYIPRKNAKSTTACIIGWWMFAKDDEPGAEIYCGATSEKQAWEVFGPARQMGVAEPALPQGTGTEINARSMVRPAENAKFEPVIGKPGDGASPHLAIVDEYHEHPDSTLYDTMKTGMGAREQPLILVISTAGENLSGPCRDDWADAEKVLDRIFEDETHFAVIWTIDLESQHRFVIEANALLWLHSLCLRYAVPFTLINERSREVFAAAAIPVIDAPISPIHAPITQTERLGVAGCAARVTSSICLTETRTERAGETPTSSSGLTAIGTRPEQRKSAGDLGLKTHQQCSPRNAKANTAFLPESIAPDTKCRAADAESANRNEMCFAWITATLRARFGDSYASNATARLVYWEILSRACTALCDTSGISGLVRPRDDLGLEVKEPADNWTTEDALRKANPNWGVSINPEIILPDQRAAVRDATKQAIFKTKHLNMWVSAARGWLNMEQWKRCASPKLDMDAFAGAECWVGLDAASRIDMTSMVAIFRHEGGYAVFANHYMPEETVAMPQHEQYRKWVAAGWLTATPGGRVDFTTVEEDLRAWSQQFNIQQFAYDPKELNDFVNRVGLWASFERVEVMQGATFISGPMKELEALVTTTKLRHEGDPVLTWMASNVVKKEARGGGPVKYYYPTKLKDSNKIDGIVALILAIGRAMLDDGKGRSVYADGGIFTV